MVVLVLVFHKVLPCILVFQSYFICSVTAALQITTTPIAQECPGDHHWPLTRIENGKVKDLAFLKDGTVTGDGVNDELGVLSLNGNGHVTFEGFADDCLTNPSRCPNGFTLSFWLKHGGIISSILGLNSKYHTALDTWLTPLVPKKSRWLPCYRATKDGWTGAVFHQKCNGKQSTLTIIKVKDFVFGGYLNETWGPGKTSIVDPKAFLFSLNNPNGTHPFKLIPATQQATVATTSPTSMPIFGQDDLVLKDNANTSSESYTTPGAVFKLASISSYSRDLFTDTKYFITDEIEVFYNQELASNRTYILTSGAENPATTGFTIFNEQSTLNGPGNLVIKVNTDTKTWTFRREDKAKSFRHMAVVWHPTLGLFYYENGQRSINRVLTEASTNKYKKTSMLLGHSDHSSSLHSGQNIQIHGLIVWHSVISSADITKNMKVACSPLVGTMSSNSFDWSQTLSTTPTALTGPSGGLSIRWFKSDSYINLKADEDFFATVDLNILKLDMFTACWRTRTRSTTTNKPLFKVSASGKTVEFSTDATTSWNHYCLKYQAKTDTQYTCSKKRYVNGKLKSSVKSSLKCYSLLGSPVKIKIGFLGRTYFDERLTDFNVWDRHLSDSEISLVSDSCSLIGGNLITWESLFSKFSDTVMQVQDRICKRDIFYVESSYPKKKGQRTRLITSEYIPTTINCLYFEYNLYGKDIGRLNVYLRNHDNKEALLWSIAGDQGQNQWKSVYIFLNNTAKSQVIFEGIVGDGYQGDLSVALVALTTTDSCNGGTGKSYTQNKGLKSNIIGHIDEYKKALQNWLSSAGLSGSWITCYRLSRKGWISSQDLHSKCANKGPTITLIRHNDDVFGGVFDQSWWEYGQCSEDSHIPSSRSFLFSLKSNAGEKVQLPIKPDSTRQAFDCSSYQRYFPNFGSDLVVDLISKTVNGSFGQTYGSTSGTFVKDRLTFEPSDIEMLVPGVITCANSCPQDMSCDEVQGVCVCNKTSRYSQSCQKGVFLDNFTSDAHDAYLMDEIMNIKNLRRAVWGRVSGDVVVTDGLGKAALSTKVADNIVLSSAHPCLTNPTSCTTNVAVSIWLRYFTQEGLSGSQPVFLFCSDNCADRTTGFSIALTDSVNEVISISVTTKTKRCSHNISFGQGVWTHIVFTWRSDSTIYKNGQKAQLLSTTCASDSYSVNTVGQVVIGQGGAVDVDDFFVWSKLLDLSRVESLHDFYKGRKDMTLKYIFKITKALDSADKELENYIAICKQVETGVKTLWTRGSLVDSASVEDCVLTPLENSNTQVSLFILLSGMSGYSEAKPLIEQLKTLKKIDSSSGSPDDLSITEVIALDLDTVYSTPCTLSISGKSNRSVAMNWTCPRKPSAGILWGYSIVVTDLDTSTHNTIKLNSANLFYNVKDLKYETRYSLTVTPVTLEGDGPPSEPAIFTTESLPLTIAPHNVTIINQNVSSITISWNFSAPGHNIVGFRLKYNPVNINFTSYIEVPSNVTKGVITGLESSTTYEIAVQGFKYNTRGPYSDLVNGSTTDGIPDVSPKNVQGKPKDATSVTVTWDAVEPQDADGGTIIGYFIKSFIASGQNAGGNFSSRMTCNTSVALTDLYPFTDYYVNISAFTYNGIGPEVQTYISNQPSAPKTPPKHVRTSIIRRTSINITWDAVSSIIPVYGYVIWYRERQSSGSNNTIEINNTMSGLIEGLQEYTQYDVRVAAFNRIGIGVYSPLMTVRTAEGPPTGAVANATTNDIQRNSSKIQWSPISASDVPGVLAGYIITIYDALRDVNTSHIVCANKTSLELTGLFPYTEYRIYLSGFTAAGAGSANKVTDFLTLEAAPDAPPQNVTSHNTSSETIQITWRPPPITRINGKLRGYYIMWFETRGDGQEIFNKTIHLEASSRRRRRSVSSPTLQTLTLDGLKKFTMYTIQIRGFTVANGVYFETNTTTAEDVPSIPPPNITAFNSSSTSITVAWQPIPVGFRHGRVLGYHVLYQEASQSSSTPEVVTVNQSVLNVELISLKKFTPYLVSVAGFTTPGTGNLSTPLNVTTDQDIPDGAPVSLAGTALSITKLSFTWQPVADKHNGIILGYTLALQDMDTSLLKTIDIKNASILATEKEGLVSWTNYTVKINAFTIKGPGPWSSDVLLTTMEELPLPPDSITAEMLSSTTIKVTWPPSNTTFLRGILRGYRVTFTPKGSVFPNIARNVTTSVDVLSTVLTDLHKFTEYDISVSAFTIGDGNQSQPVVEKTDSDAPSSGPSPIRKVGATPYGITLELGSVPPDQMNGILTGYKVVTTRIDSSDLPKQNQYGPTETIAVINGLAPFTQYLFQVFASTNKGWGVPSNATLRTGEAAPTGLPTNVANNKRFSVDSIPLKWAPLTPAQANGEVLGYRVTYQLVTLGDEPVEDAPIKEFDVNGTSTLIENLELYGGYKITIAAFTSKGLGPAITVIGETCRCHRILYSNWRTYSPYVQLSPETGELEGIFPNMVKQMTEECCQTCQSHNHSVVEFNTTMHGSPALKDNEDELKTNISEDVDFSFPLFGTKEQTAYQGGFGYRALVESPGIVYVVNIDTGEQEGPHMTIIRSLLGCLPYILFTVLLAYLAGFIMWILDRQINSELFPLSFVKGTYEGLWWAFITMTTLGYGDRYPKSFTGKAFAIYWMLMGIVTYGLLTSVLQTAITTVTITIDTQFNGKEIIAIHNSPEYRLGQRFNIPMNKVTQPKTFQELYDALITRKAYGAFIDAYAIGQRKDLFEHPSLKFAQIYDMKSAYGIVLGGTSTRLKKCFLNYLQAKRAEVFARIAKYTKFVETPPDEMPRSVDYSTGLFTADTDVFNYTIFSLFGFWLFLMMLGCVYEVIRRKMTQAKDEKRKELEQLKKDVQEFVENMKEIHQKLRKKHLQELKDLMRYRQLSQKYTIKTLKKFFT